MIEGKEDTVTATKKQGTVDLIRSYFEERGIKVTDNIGMNLQGNSVELIDTGSTGRGTNVPGDGDFDFMLRHNTSPEILEGLKTLIMSKAQNSVVTNDGFRTKSVTLENGESADIDVTCARKNLTLEYSSDMCVKDRLHSIEEQNPQMLRYVKANIIMAKKILKASEIYKKRGSQGATEFGGFGGIGVENWILQNGGSFEQAMATYLEAANKADSYNDFIESYPIFDFGNNQREGNTRHDRFSAFLGQETGFSKVKEIFTQNLDMIKNTKTPLQKSMSVEGLDEATKNNERIKNFNNWSLLVQMLAKYYENINNHNTIKENDVENKIKGYR